MAIESTPVIVLEVPACPPSFNSIATKGTHWKYTKAKKEWGVLLRRAIEQASGVPPCEAMFVEGEVTFPDRRERDQGNFRSTLEKFLGDVLVKDRIIPKDTWKHYEFGNLAYRYEKGVSRTRLVLMPR